MPDLGNSYCLL